MPTHSTLDDSLHRLAQAPVLLVATDYDGTIAPIVSDPAAARPHHEAVVALRMLASLAHTHVAVISGRSLRDLADFLNIPADLHLVGSHGSEFDLDFATSLDPALGARLDQTVRDLEQIAGDEPGFQLERKPASVAFHYRNADPERAREAVARIERGPAAREGIHTRHGKRVIELSVIGTDKGAALDRLRARVGASAVVFFGDDNTDEDAFATLAGPDVGVKIGPGATIAGYRVDGPETVARLLARLAELREEWLAGAEATPIESHALLSDQRTIALVTPAGRINWLCLPRIDSPAIFAELLGGPPAGYFAIESADGAAPESQVYRDGSMTIETRWPDFTLTDVLDCSDGRPRQRPGRSDLLRILSGRGRVRIEFAPRLDFGRIATGITAHPDGLVVQGSPDRIVLRCPGVAWEIVARQQHQSAIAEVELGDEPLCLELRYGTGSLRYRNHKFEQRLAQTDGYWNSWGQRLQLPEVAPDAVLRSALLLKSLCFGPTGAISAAGTTSLPERIGGIRNWDYRYCWLRDGAMSAACLVKLGSNAEALHFLDWVLRVVEHTDSPDRLMPLYDVAGQPLGPEAEIGELSGYRGSRPVRVGNAAARQVQLDVFGPIVELLALLVERDAPLAASHWHLVELMVNAVARRWRDPDHGIWEIRKPPRHHVHSKVMCWVTIDRAIKAARLFLDDERRDWAMLRDEIANDVLARGHKPEVNAFTAAYDGTDLDAAALYVGLTGLVSPEDPRFRGTVAAVEQHLRQGATVFRYRADDGLPGHEGGFHICTSWLIEAYVLMGRNDDARALFEEMLALAGPTGLLSEEYDPDERLALGNTPQAYSHIGVIETALRLAQVR